MMDNKLVLTKVLKKLTIKTDDGAEIPILNKNTERIEVNCNNEGISDYKVITRYKE